MNLTAESVQPRLAPVDPRHRIETVDMVRGFALFGVLLVNMYNFGASSPIWTGFADQTAFSIKRFLFETKSWRLFSLLFGLGFSFQLLSAKASRRRFIPTYIRRLVVLFVIGMAHALFYDGDILMLYAELGLLLTVFVNVPPRRLLMVAIALLAVFPVGGAVRSIANPSDSATAQPEFDLAAALARREGLRQTHPYAVGSLTDVMALNAEAIPPNPLIDPLGPESNLAFFAMFLLGLYVGKRRIFQNIEGHRDLVRGVFKWGITVGLLSMTLERLLAFRWGYEVFGGRGASLGVEFLGDFAFAYGSTALCLGYAAAIVLAAQSEKLRWLVAPLGPVGRLGLSVYLTQTLAFTTLFYGYGFGQGLETGPTAVTAWAILIFGLQVVACSWWVRRYRFGPAEWVWRSLTYLRFQPMRLPS